MVGQNNWEFLLQQEGDRSWLPLESPDVEILEGRYRVLIRTAATNTQIGIQITHEATEESPPKRRTQTRSGRTSADGLMVIIPFTLLHPGIWEMSCTPNDLTSDLLGYAGHYSIQLHVLPKESDLAGEWEPDWSQPVSEEFVSEKPVLEESSNEVLAPVPEAIQPIVAPIAEPIAAPMAEPIAEPIVAPITNPIVTPITNSIATPVVKPIAEPIAASVTKPIVTQVTSPIPNPIADLIPDRNPPLTLTLTSQTYDIQPGQTLILSGALTSSEASPQPIELKNCTFTTTVRDPQSGDPIVTTPITFTTLLLPYDVQMGIVLPITLTGQLFLGEITFTYGTEELPRVTQSFTLLSALDRLLSALPEPLKSTTRPNATDDLPVPPADPAGPEFNDAFLGMINQTTAPTEFRTTAPSQLPPKLYQPNADRSDRPPLALPAFLRTPAPETDLNALFEPETGHDPALSPFDLPEEDGLDPDLLDEDFLYADTDRLEEDRLLSEVPELESDSDRYTDVNRSDALGSDRFQDLDQDLDQALPDDFYNTTAPLDLDDPDDLKTIDITSERITAEQPPLSAPPTPPEILLNPFATRRPVPTETVVLNDPTPMVMAPFSLVESLPETIPDDDPIPTPRLEIEAVTEVVAGQSLAIKLKLPDLQPKLYVKLWINDRATRTLLDGPRYLIDFLASAEPDTLEATTTLTVPLGSLEIQIEAITIETATKRESYKASALLSVIPPNLPEFSLDDIKF